MDNDCKYNRHESDKGVVEGHCPKVENTYILAAFGANWLGIVVEVGLRSYVFDLSNTWEERFHASSDFQV